jgi:DNA polymerase III subunit epsilon
MINFFKELFSRKKIDIPENAPDFVKDYLRVMQSATKKTNQSIIETRFVVFDTETTGLDFRKDKILSIGALTVQENQIKVVDSFELFILREDITGGEAVDVHGILKKGKKIKIPETEAIAKFLNFCGDSILVGHHIGFDIAIINQLLTEKYGIKLHNQVIDTMLLHQRVAFMESYDSRFIPDNPSLDALAKLFDIDTKDRHKALGDAYITGIVFLKLLNQLKKRGVTTIGRLLNNRLY